MRFADTSGIEMIFFAKSVTVRKNSETLQDVIELMSEIVRGLIIASTSHAIC